MQIFSDAEKEGNPMVMGFQDEIDDEDYLRSSHLNHPATQISDSSDEEMQTQQSDRKVPVFYNVTQSLSEDVTVEDDLDDWLNDGSEPSASTKSKSVVTVKNETIPSVSSLNVEPKAAEEEESLEEPPVEVTSKGGKKIKEKKHKRKSKKSSKERSSSSPITGTDVIDQSRPYDEYEEI